MRKSTFTEEQIVYALKQADAEFAAAAEWYDGKQLGLGEKFEQDVYDAFDVILESPNAWQRWPSLESARVFPMDRFSYLLPYVVRDDNGVILGVAHAKRRSGYWRSRIDTDEQ